LVDEYQDINAAQLQLIKLLGGKTSQGLFVVGDDDQSIYSFRGGSPEYVRHFRDQFGETAHVLPISLCRRCPPPVLRAAISIVEKFNPDRLPKADPAYVSTVSTPICLLNCPTEEKEAQVIAAKCARVTPSHDVLILVPQLSFARPILQSLRRSRVAYDCRAIVLEGGLTILDTLGDWLADKNDSFSLRQAIHNLITTDNFDVPSHRVRKPEKIAQRNAYLAEISSLWQDVITKKSTLYQSLKDNAAKSQFLADLLKAIEELASAYDSPPNNFLESIGRIEQPWGTPREMFQEISSWIDEVKGRGSAGQASVRVMSMRLAKGLEADFVFVVGLDSSIFPRTGLSPSDLAESSRLMFVSMTRARVELILCHSRKRSPATTHMPKPFGLKQSPFIDTIPKELLDQQYIQGDSTK
jgi:DNA helicase-2/ATP-dependent DNA helicase PcrA